MFFEVGGQTLVVPDEPVQVTIDAAKGEIRRRLDVIPPVSLRFASDVRLFAPGAARPVEVVVAAFRAGAAGTLQLDAPAGWKIAPATQSFKFAKVGDKAKFVFTVTAPPQPAKAAIVARAEVNGAKYDNQRVEIRYDHIPLQLLQPPARLKAVSLDLAIRGHQVGYLPGAGDSVAEAFGSKWATVTRLTGRGPHAGAVERFRCRGDRHSRVQRPNRSRDADDEPFRLRRSRRQRHRAIQPAKRPANGQARAVRPAAVAVTV